MSNNINIEPVQEEPQDFLEVDDEIRGQKYCLLSFIEPEDVIQNKEAFKTAKYLQSINKNDKKSFKDFYEQYLDFQYKYHDDIEKDYIKENGLKTNMRGVKVRGVYDTEEEAKQKAAQLQKKDSLFHVFLGEVGYWLPFNPLPDKIKDEVFINEGLQELMEGYKQNAINKDILYEEEKREKLKHAAEELKKGREQEDKFIREAQKKLEEENNAKATVTEENNAEVTVTEENNAEVTVTEESNNNLSLEAEIDNENINLQNSDDVINNLSNQDPWLKKKLEQENTNESNIKGES
jgi:hypothetical protein